MCQTDEGGASIDSIELHSDHSSLDLFLGHSIFAFGF
jgi:hypothetical protein